MKRSEWKLLIRKVPLEATAQPPLGLLRIYTQRDGIADTPSRRRPRDRRRGPPRGESVDPIEIQLAQALAVGNQQRQGGWFRLCRETREGSSKTWCCNSEISAPCMFALDLGEPGDPDQDGP